MAEFIVVHSIKVAKDFTPETFGRLTTIGPVFYLRYGKARTRAAAQVCVCDCGNYTVVPKNNIRGGHTTSCGCNQLKAVSSHGKSRSVEYMLWSYMKQRCHNPEHKAYRLYGGRGISVHPDWRAEDIGFTNFLADMGPRPSPKHSIDRYPNRDGNYEPGNVRWATMKEQSRNKRNNVLLTHNGKTQCVAAWAEEFGISPATLRRRLKAGWTIKNAIEKPSGKWTKQKKQ